MNERMPTEKVPKRRWLRWVVATIVVITVGAIFPTVGAFFVLIVPLCLWRNWFRLRERVAADLPFLTRVRPGVLAILVFFGFGMLMAGLGGAGWESTSVSTKTQQASTPPSPAAPTAAFAPTPEPTSGSTPVPTATPLPPSPTPRPSPTAQVGTRQNPVPLGKAYVFRKGGRVYAVGVLEVVRNALARVKAANMFNEDPPPGHDYILVRLGLEYIEGPENQPMITSSGEHRFYAANRLWGAPIISVPPKPRFDGQEIFPGAKVAGWLAGKYIPIEAMDEAMLVYDGIYFALR